MDILGIVQLLGLLLRRRRKEGCSIDIGVLIWAIYESIAVHA